MSDVGNAIPLSKINGKMRKILVPGILHNVSREQLWMRIPLQTKKSTFFFFKYVFNISFKQTFAN